VKDVKVSVLFHSAAVQMCVELVSYLPSSLSVCPVCNAPFALLSQETLAFPPQSRQGGAEVRRQFCHGGRGSVSFSITSGVIISTKYFRKTLSWLETSFYMWCFIAVLSLGAPSKACTALLWDQRGHVHCEVDGVWTNCRGPLWKISLEAFEENELLDAWTLVVGCSGCRCDIPGSS